MSSEQTKVSQPLAAAAGSKVVRFVVSGGLQTVYAFSMNALLVKILGLYEPVAYALLQASLMALGLFLSRQLVFDRGKAGLATVAGQYGVATICFRAANWAVYTVLWHVVGLPFLVAQAITIAAFLPVKFVVLRRIFEGDSGGTGDAVSDHGRPGG